MPGNNDSADGSRATQDGRQRRARPRPWYLVVAIMGSLAFGVGGGCAASHTITRYRHSSVDTAELTRSIPDEAYRALAQARLEDLLTAMDGAKSVLFPLSVALLVMSTAMMLMAMRAMAGRATARSALVQVVVVQAVLTIAGFVLSRDVRRAELAVEDVAEAIAVSDAGKLAPLARLQFELHKLQPLVLVVLRTLGSVGIVVALTRPRSRDFFEAARGPATEP